MGIPLSKITGAAGLFGAKTNKNASFQPRSTMLRKPPMLWSRCLNGGLSSALDTSGTSRNSYTTVAACHDPEVLFANYQVSTGEIASPNSVLVSATLEYPANTFHRLTFGGKQFATIDPYSYLKSDLVAINLPANTPFWVRTYFQIQTPPASAPTVTAGAGGTLAAATYYYKVTSVGPTGESGPSAEASAVVSASGTATISWTAAPNATSYKVYRATATGGEVYLTQTAAFPTSFVDTGAIAPGAASPPAAQRLTVGPGAANAVRAGEGINYPSASGGNGSDQTTTLGTAWETSQNNLTYAPVAILATPDAGFSVPVVALIGDSIMGGTNDLNDRGFAARALVAANIPYHYCARGGETVFAVSPLTNNTGFRMRMAIVEGCTDAVSNYATNDFVGARTLAQVKADLLAFWGVLALRGVRVWQTTILPRTTSTDNWATAGNQTVPTWEASRTALNDWLKDLSGSGAMSQAAGALSGVFDIASTVEVNASNALTVNGGRWISNGTGFAYCDNIGTHPSALATALMAPVIDTTRFTAV